jgi:transcriptional regulator with XRE-family HTH domain
MSSNAEVAMPGKKRDPRKPDRVDVAVGHNVCTWRIARGLSQTQLGERLGVTFQQVQKYEAGTNRMSTGRLVKAAAILKVPMAAFFADAEAAEPRHALIANSRAYRLAQAFAVIKSDKFRVSLVEMVEALAKLPQKPKRRRRPSRRAK